MFPNKRLQGTCMLCIQCLHVHSFQKWLYLPLSKERAVVPSPHHQVKAAACLALERASKWRHFDSTLFWWNDEWGWQNGRVPGWGIGWGERAIECQGHEGQGKQEVAHLPELGPALSIGASAYLWTFVEKSLWYSLCLFWFSMTLLAGLQEWLLSSVFEYLRSLVS